MTTGIHKISIDDTGYVNVSQGQASVCVELQQSERLRCAFAGATAPARDSNLYVHFACPGGIGRVWLQVENLGSEPERSSLWLRAEDGHGPWEVTIMRGEARFAVVVQEW